MSDNLHTCAIYVRANHVSRTSEQLATTRAFGRLRQWSSPEDLVWIDAPVSGNTPFEERPAMTRLMQELSKPHLRFKWILVDQVSRISRKMNEVVRFYDMISHHGVSLLIVPDLADQTSPKLNSTLKTGSIRTRRPDQEVRKALVSASPKGATNIRLAIREGLLRTGEDGQVQPHLTHEVGRLLAQFLLSCEPTLRSE